jgi:hypothetical protein
MAVDLNEQTRGRLRAAYRAADTRGRAELLAQLAQLAWWNASVRDRLEADARHQAHVTAFPWLSKKPAPTLKILEGARGAG